MIQSRYLAKSSIVMLLFLFTLQGCSYKDVEYKGVDGIDLEKSSDKKVQLNIGIKIKNPNNYNIKLKNGKFDLFVGGKNVGEALMKKKVVIPKNSEETQMIQLLVDRKSISKGMMSGLLGVLTQGGLEVGVKGTMKAKVFLYGKKIDVDFKKKIDASQLKNLNL